MTSDELAAYLDGRGIDVRRHGRGYRCLCPVHDDRNPSLDFQDGERGIIVNCRAGCKTSAIVEAWGLTLPELFFDLPKPTGVIDEYEYLDENRRLLFVVERREGKQFRQRRPDGNGGWIWNLNGTRRVPYRLPRVIEAVREGKVVCIAEGEKDVHALERAGRVATCNPGGAGKWRDEYAVYFKGATVFIIADRDDAGRAHARAVLDSLSKVAKSVTIIEPAEGKDASDHLARHSFAEFVETRLADRNGRLPHPRIIDMDEAMRLALEPLPERCGMFAVDGFVTTLAGMRSERKSWLSLALCAAVANGSEVAGIRCEPGIALYIDAENGKREMARRFKSLNAGRGGFWVADGMGIHLPRDTSIIRDLILSTGANLCILDSLRRLAPTVREDRSDDMAPVFAEISKLARETNCAIVVLHHRSTKWNAADTRGSSAIEDQTDLLYVLESVRGDPERRFRKRLRCPKNRVDVEPPARWLMFDHVAGYMTIAKTEPYEPDEDEAPTKVEQLIGAIRELADEVRKDHAWPPRMLADRLGIDPQAWAFKQALGDLLASGEWVAEGKTRARVVRPIDLGGPDPLGGTTESTKTPEDPETRLPTDFSEDSDLDGNLDGDNDPSKTDDDEDDDGG